MAEDKIYISRMLKAVIGNVADMSTAMTQLSTAMADVKTEIVNSVTALNQVVDNTADMLVEIAIQADETGASKLMYPSAKTVITGSGMYDEYIFVGGGAAARSMASGTIRVTVGILTESGNTGGGIIGDGEEDTITRTNVDKYGKTWDIHPAVRIGQEVYYGDNMDMDAVVDNPVYVPVKNGDVLEFGFYCKKTTTDESAKPIKFTVSENWFKVYYKRSHVNDQTAIMPIY